MAGKIFLNYRRGDEAGFTQALYQRLEYEFTSANLFMDVEGYIRPGDDFVEVLRSQIEKCDVLLVLIGPRWAELLATRASDSNDFVVIEISAALDGRKRVIPVLVGGARMPSTGCLPKSIEALSRRNAVELRPERFKVDCESLIASLKVQLTTIEREHNSQLEKLAGAHPRSRLGRALAAMVKGDEEVSAWADIAASRDVTAIEAFLSVWPDGKYAATAKGVSQN